MRRAIRLVTSAACVATALHLGGPLGLVFFVVLSVVFTPRARAGAA